MIPLIVCILGNFYRAAELWNRQYLVRIVAHSSEDTGWGGGLMQSYQWFLLGVLSAWTPGLVILAVMLKHAFAASADGGAERRTSSKPPRDSASAV